MATRKVKLATFWRDARHDHILPWNSAVPFTMSKQGALVHRVRYATTHLHLSGYGWKTPCHDCVTYWCGNSTTSPLWFEVPPEGRIVCANCEARAVANGLPTTDQLAGKHVHVGVLKAHKTCCDDRN